MDPIDLDTPRDPINDLIDEVRSQTGEMTAAVGLEFATLESTLERQAGDFAAGIDDLKWELSRVRESGEHLLSAVERLSSTSDIREQTEQFGSEIAGTTSEVMTLGNIVNLRAALMSRWLVIQTVVLLLILWRIS